MVPTGGAARAGQAKTLVPAGRFLLLLLVLAYVGAGATSPLLAQVSDQPSQTPRFRSSADVVLVDVSVVDSRGVPVVDLERKDFEIWEDGARREIVYFNREFADKPTPSSVVLLLDVSSSMKGDAIIEAGRAAADFVRRMPDEAEIALLTFDHEIRTASPFSKDRKELEDAIQDLEAGGGTALYDAMAVALELFTRASHQRKILVVLSDGKDLDSQSKFGRIEQRFEQNPIIVYALGYYTQSERDLYMTGEKYYKEPAFEVNLNPVWVLERLASLSGGLVLFPTRRDELSAFFSEIASDLRHQYVLGYTPPASAGEPRFRAINVRVREAAHGESVGVRARRGYVR